MQVFDAAKCLTALAQDSTLIVVVEMSLSSWLVAGLIPGVERQALKKLDPDPQALLALMARWREEAKAAGHAVARTVLAYEAGRDGFWLARWLRARDIEAYVMHPTSIAVSREHRRAKSDRLDTALLMRAFLGWLRGELKHCSMAAIPSMQEEDAKRPNRERQTLTEESTRLINRMKAMLIRFGIRDVDPGLAKFAKQLDGLVSPEGQGLPANSLAELKRDMARLQLLKEQLKAIDKGRAMRLAAPACEAQPEAKVKRLAGIVGLGEATADMLVSEVLSRQFKDRRALARYAGLTGSPDESGTKRRDKGLSRSGNSRVRRGMIQLAWRFTRFQPDSPLTQWFKSRTSDGRKDNRKRMIVALARKLLIAVWRLAEHGVVPEGIVMRAAA